MQLSELGWSRTSATYELRTTRQESIVKHGKISAREESTVHVHYMYAPLTESFSVTLQLCRSVASDGVASLSVRFLSLLSRSANSASLVSMSLLLLLYSTNNISG